MKSGTCDQVYCSPTQGCYSKKTNSGYQSYYPGSGTWKPVMSSDKLSRYGALFDEAANYLLIGNNNVVMQRRIINASIPSKVELTIALPLL